MLAKQLGSGLAGSVYRRTPGVEILETNNFCLFVCHAKLRCAYARSKKHTARLKTISDDLMTVTQQLLLEKVKASTDMRTFVIECQSFISYILNDDFVKSKVVIRKNLPTI